MAFIDEILKRQEQQNNAQEIRIMRLPDKTQDLTAMGLPDLTKAPIYPAAAQAFGNVPVNMPPNPLDTSPQISAPAQRLEAPQQEPQQGQGFLSRMFPAKAPSGVSAGISPFGGGSQFRTEATGASIPSDIRSAIPMGLPGALPFEAPQSPVATGGLKPPSDSITSVPAIQTGETQAVPQGSSFTTGDMTLPSESIGQIPNAGVFSQESAAKVNPLLAQQDLTQQAQAAPQDGLTTAGGTPLSQFLEGGAIPEAGIARPESGLYSSESRGISGAAGRDIMAQASAEREARLAARPDFMEAQKRSPYTKMDGGAGELSMAEATRLTGGNRDAARAMIERQRQGLGEFAPTKTAQEGMTPYQKAQIELQKAGLGLKVTEAEAKAAGASQKQYDKMAKAAGALQSLEADLNLVREKGEEIKDLTMKPRTEGILAKAIAKLSPTSTAAQLERASGTLTGDAFIKGMRVIKEFGGGLGSVTEAEGMKVERAQGAIFETGMSDVERRNAVDNYLKVRENAYNRIRSAFVDEFGEEPANRYLGNGTGQASAASNGAVQVPTVEGVTIEEII